MAIDDAGRSGSGGGESAEGDTVVAGEYTWRQFYAEYGDANEREAFEDAAENGHIDWERFQRAGADPTRHLGFDPEGTADVIGAATESADRLARRLGCDVGRETPVVKGEYTWEHYKWEYFYDEVGNPPTDKEDEPLEFDPAEALGVDPEQLESTLADMNDNCELLEGIIDRRTVNVSDEVDEDAFFSTDGRTTIVNRYDLEKAVPLEKKTHFREVDRYWVNKPFAFVILFHSIKENEKKYYVIQPYRTEIETELQEFLTGKLRSSIKYAKEGVAAEHERQRREVIEAETYTLLDRYDIYSEPDDRSPLDPVTEALEDERVPEQLRPEALERRFDVESITRQLGLQEGGTGRQLLERLGWEPDDGDAEGLTGITARPEPAVLAEDAETLTEYQVEKLLYYLQRNFIGYERIDGIKHDINVEDISCDGYNSPVFVYHSDYEQIISNVYHGEDELDDFVVKLAQRSGKGISKRSPQVDATLPDGSRAQLTLGREVSDHGTNYTIRQFKDVPFTPVDLINWNTFNLEEMAFLWLCIENHKSLIFAGGTASGKTTSLNAVSLFIPSNSKIVSIEDTREVELPQRNWIASVTRPSFSEDGKGDIDEFDLLEAALRQRPDYIVMGEIRGEEGRTLFQVMSTGHTTYTTFHADSVGEVLKRFTTEPINVSKTMFTALDLVSIQTSTRVAGHKVRRNKSLTEINRYDADSDEINVQDVYQWQAETDKFLKMGESNTLDEIMFDRGWDHQTLEDEIFQREAVLAYLINHGLNTYTQVAATFQAFINDPETILTLMANNDLEDSLEDLREMESVEIDIDPEKEEMVPRPDANEEILAETDEILAEAEERLFDQYRGEEASDIAAVLAVDAQPDIVAEPGGGELLDAFEEDDDPSGGDEPSEADRPDDGEAAGEDDTAGDGTAVAATDDLSQEVDDEAIGQDDRAIGQDDRAAESDSRAAENEDSGAETNDWPDEGDNGSIVDNEPIEGDDRSIEDDEPIQDNDLIEDDRSSKEETSTIESDDVIDDGDEDDEDIENTWDFGDFEENE